MIRVIGLDECGYPMDIGVEEGTIDSVRTDLERRGYTVIYIEEE